jgi:hypothetical protein
MLILLVDKTAEMEVSYGSFYCGTETKNAAIEGVIREIKKDKPHHEVTRILLAGNEVHVLPEKDPLPLYTTRTKPQPPRRQK